MTRKPQKKVEWGVRYFYKKSGVTVSWEPSLVVYGSKREAEEQFKLDRTPQGVEAAHFELVKVETTKTVLRRRKP